jgi:hypothetical protein
MQILSATISKNLARQDFFAECVALSLQLPKQYHTPQSLQRSHTRRTKKGMSINFKKLVNMVKA